MSSKPNILVFMTDQQRGDTLTDPRIHMPNVRSLMRDGLHFDNTYCPSPHCCPSRASFFTGLYPSQHEVWNNVCVQNTLSKRIKPGTELFSTLLDSKGYDLYFAGKWHVCSETGPEDYGFKELHVTNNKISKNDPTVALMSPGWEMYHSLAEQLDKQESLPRKEGEIRRKGYPEYVHYGQDENPFDDMSVIDSALSQIVNMRDDHKPWMMYIGTLGPHDPYFVPQRFLDMYENVEIELTDIHFDTLKDKPTLYRRTQRLFNQLSLDEKKEAIRHYMAFCTYEDYLFGLILEQLKNRADYDDTLIIFTSDHGDYNGEHGLWCKGLPAFKGGYHIPAVVSWKNGIKNAGRRISELISLADFSPTITELVGETVADNVIGKSLLPFINDETPNSWRDYLFTQTNGNEVYGIQRSVFNDDWKLVHNTFDEDELYDLKRDPHELMNLADCEEYKEVKKELFKQIWSFAAKTEDQSLNPYIMVGLAEFGPAYAYASHED
ncbi:sulfatase-like hydrolase/transferase [Thaumasiovibrio sp. DFM-14]|uniref:sulfatase-like hydrolase/transferase n=1 Tax=Thaumasiovibrio sp. DFM-14 TaxID=3384792 RepID=UPI00399F0365